MTHDYPILEFDPDTQAMIEPQTLIEPVEGIPEHCVICFFYDVIEHMRERGLLKEVAAARSEMGRHPIYEFKHDGRSVALFHPGVGAPLAAALFEEVIAFGCRKFIACGGAGVLDSGIAVGHLLVPVSAVRDEGTSYHYLPPDREVSATPEAVRAIEKVLKKRSVAYLPSKTWTTDAFYRETPKKVAQRKAEGCLSVEMEAAALFAVAQFRGVQIGQILYGGDDLGGEYWDSRNWEDRWEVRAQLIWLAAEACLAL